MNFIVIIALTDYDHWPDNNVNMADMLLTKL